MSYRVEDIASGEWPMAKIARGWVKSRPVVAPLLSRLRDAWRVLIGRLDAVGWDEQ